MLASAWAEAGGGAALLALLLAVPSAILAVVFNQTSDSPGHAATFAGAAATAFLLAWCYGQDRLALAGSWGILAVFAHLLLWDIGPDYIAHPVLAALLVHASMALTASLVLERRLRRNEGAEGEDWCRRVRYLIIRPLSRTGIWSTLLAVPFIAGGLDGPLLGLAVLTLWLALLWLAGAWVRRRWDLFAAFQAALAVTVLLAVSGVYQVRGYRPGEPRNVQIHALALGVLSLLWVLARRTPRVFGLFADLLPRGWPAVDRVVLAGLIGVHFLTAAVILAPGVAAEYALERAIAATPPAPAAEDELPDNIDPVEEVPPAHQEVAKPPQPDRVNLVPQLLAQMRGATQWPAWTLTTLLAVILLIEARVSVHRGVVLGFLALAVTTALLVSALFAADHAVTYGLRWSLAICFLICSLPVWFRDSWGPRLERFGFRAPAETDLAALARRVLVICTVVPVLLLAIAPPLLRLYGVTVSPPLESSLFGRMPRIHATVWPLTFICFGLIVHALRERLPDYAFVVGLGGNVLASIILRASLKVAAPLQTWWLPLVQANVIAFGIAALLWLIARRRLYGERGTGPFLDVQVRLALYGNLVLLAGAFIPLLVDPSGMARTLVQAGHWRGWLALALAGTATWWYLTATQRPRLPLAMALGLAASVLLAASAAWLAKWRPTWLAQPWLAFHVLTAAWTVCGTVFLAFLWRQDARVRRSDGTISPRSFALREIARQWMGILILVLLGLALRATIAADPLGPWWCAGVVLGGGALTAGMAIWQRRGDWAFAAGLCLNLAVSLVVWHTIRTEPGTRLWVWLLQANVIASAAVSCLWLLTRRRMVTEGSRLTADLWLFGQIMLGLAGNLILLGHAAFWLIALPHAPPESVALVGVTSGWLAFTATLVPIVWFAGRALFKGGLVLLTGLTLSLAVLTAATAAHWDHDWLAYHVLLAGCGLAVVPPLLSGIRIWSLSNAAEPVLFALDTGAAVRRNRVRTDSRPGPQQHPRRSALSVVGGRNLAVRRRNQRGAGVPSEARGLGVRRRLVCAIGDDAGGTAPATHRPCRSRMGPALAGERHRGGCRCRRLVVRHAPIVQRNASRAASSVASLRAARAEHGLADRAARDPRPRSRGTLGAGEQCGAARRLVVAGPGAGRRRNVHGANPGYGIGERIVRPRPGVGRPDRLHVRPSGEQLAELSRSPRRVGGAGRRHSHCKLEKSAPQWSECPGDGSDRCELGDGSRAARPRSGVAQRTSRSR